MSNRKKRKKKKEKTLKFTNLVLVSLKIFYVLSHIDSHANYVVDTLA